MTKALEFEKQLQNLLAEKSLPSYDYLFSLLDSITTVLEEEIFDYRVASSDGTAGSLLEFQEKKPVIIVPDIHARPDFVKNILFFEIPALKKNVIQALSKDEIFLVALGDAVHTEGQNKARWLFALDDYLVENFTGQAMTEEITECLSVVSALMELKLAFPRNFHFLKGNHENIMNRNGGGDFSFRKFADEGNMTRDFIHAYYGEDILYLISLYENALPLVFASPRCVISHAEPHRTYTRQELIDARLDALVVEGLTWTRNGEAEEGAVQNIIANIFNYNRWNTKDVLYFVGHSPVHENYALRQNARLVQFHNPFRQNIALLCGNKKFNPDKDILGVQENER